MTTTTLAPASPPPALDLDARLALLDAAMTVRLDEAAVAFEVNTAHIVSADPTPDVAEIVPLTPVLAPTVSPYNTPLADLLHRAHTYIATRGLLRGALRDDNDVEGARCPVGAIRYEAGGNRWQADDACALLLEAIQRDFPSAETVPSWVDAQTSPTPVLLALGRAADIAHNRNL